MIYRVRGALFFGATAALSTVLDRDGAHPKLFVLDFEEVPLIDSTAANALRGFVGKLRRAGTRVCSAGARRGVRRVLINAGFRRPEVVYTENVESALQQTRGSGQAS